MIAGIVIETWKFDTFKKHLDDAGYMFTKHPGIVLNTFLLKVDTKDQKALQTVVEAAQSACHRSKMQ